MNEIILSVEQQKEVLEMYNLGLSLDKINAKTGIGLGPITKIIKRNGVMRKREISIEEKEKIKQDFLSGLDTSDLVKIYNRNKRTIHSILNNFGIKLRRESGCILDDLPESEISKIIECYKNGESQTSISKDYNVPQTTLSRFLRKRGIFSKLSGSGNSQWKGGKHLHKISGYVLIKLLPTELFFDMTNTNGYVLEHRLVIARHLGRSLTKKEQVHHKNGIRHDNRIENLQLVYGSHGNGVRLKCRKCGCEDIEMTDV